MNPRPQVSSPARDELKSQTCGCHKVSEFACNLCLLCVCCPLSVLWCFIKFPCDIGLGVVKRARRLHRRVSATYSSFSDIDSEEMASTKETHPRKESCCCILSLQKESCQTN